MAGVKTFHRKVISYGRSLGITIPKEIVELKGLKRGDIIRVYVEIEKRG